MKDERRDDISHQTQGVLATLQAAEHALENYADFVGEQLGPLGESRCSVEADTMASVQNLTDSLLTMIRMSITSIHQRVTAAVNHDQMHRETEGLTAAVRAAREQQAQADIPTDPDKMPN